MRPLQYAACGVAAVLCALSAPLPAAESQLSLTIYNNDLALVQDQRRMDLAAGRTRLEFKDVSAGIRPETVSLEAPGLAVLEQNFDYDLLTPHKLMEKAVGRQVRLVRYIPGSGAQETATATVMSVNDGVVLKVGDHIEVLRQDDIPTRVIFDKIPSNLRAQPTLSVSVDVQRPGPRLTTLSYLTTGLSWRADYVALLDEKAGKLDMQGWITLENTSGTTFENAEAHLVAGNVNTVQGSFFYGHGRERQRWAAQSGNSGDNTTAQVADYYIYPLPQRTTIANQQTKQVGFLEANGVKAQKSYRYRADGFSSDSQPRHADVVVQFDNSAQSSLGVPLPKGIVRVYVRDAGGRARFVGEDNIDHTPQGSQLSIRTGEAFDVTVERILTEKKIVDKHHTRYRMEYRLHNARGNAVTVQVCQRSPWRDNTVVDESMKGVQDDAYTLRWSVPVPANGDNQLAFTVETAW